MKIQEDQQSFEVKMFEGKQYYEIQWRAEAKWTGMELFWHFFVHPTGRFPDETFTNLDGSLMVMQKLDGVLKYEAMEYEKVVELEDGEEMQVDS